MNSHQRRKDRREYRYHISAPAQDWGHYMAMFEWCQRNFGPCVDDGWRDPRWLSERDWRFNCPRKAQVFALRWS